jgi:hypothetical protein
MNTIDLISIAIVGVATLGLAVMIYVFIRSDNIGKLFANFRSVFLLFILIMIFSIVVFSTYSTKVNPFWLALSSILSFVIGAASSGFQYLLSNRTRQKLPSMLANTMRLEVAGEGNITQSQNDTAVDYPQAYRQALSNDPSITNLQILDMGYPLQITRIYVQLSVHQQTQSEYLLREDLLIAESQHDPRLVLQANPKRAERLRQRALEPDEALRRYKRCIILGDPGMGKTTLMKYLTLHSAQGDLSELPDLPIYIALNSFITSGFKDLLGFAAHEWYERYDFPREQTLSYIRESLANGKVLLLIDALDETLTGSQAEERYQAITREIDHLVGRYPKSPIVVTTRKASYYQRTKLHGFTELEILDFRMEDIKQFVKNWFENSPDPMQKDADDLIMKLERNPRIQCLASNPLFLSLIVMVYQAQLDLPDRRAELYKQCTDILLMRWDASRDIRRRRELKPEYTKQLLQDIAWHFHQKGQVSFRKDDLVKVIARFLETVDISPKENEDILKEIAANSGLLKAEATDRYTFSHLTLQEYFASRYAIEQRSEDQQILQDLFKHRRELWWEEVILLYAGSGHDASPFLKMLLNDDDTGDIFYTNLILAGRCLATRPKLREHSLREDIMTRLVNILITTPYTFSQKQISDTLAEIGGRSISDLLKLLQRRNTDIRLRSYIIDALGKSGAQWVVPNLFSLLHDPDQDTQIRRRSALAIGQLGDNSAVPALLKMLQDTHMDDLLYKDIAAAIGSLGYQEIVSDLLALLQQEDLDTQRRGYIAETLRQLDDTSSISELQMLPEKSKADYELAMDKPTNSKIIAALSQATDKRSVETLIDYLKDSDLEVANEAYEALWNIARRTGEIIPLSVIQ